jgi:hypothetical protein
LGKRGWNGILAKVNKVVNNLFTRRKSNKQDPSFVASGLPYHTK